MGCRSTRSRRDAPLKLNDIYPARLDLATKVNTTNDTIMIPPIDTATVNANPRFAALHKTLTTKLLNPDGSTKSHRTQAERNARAPELHRLQVEAAKTLILKDTLSNLPLTEEKRSSRPPRTTKVPSTTEVPLPPDITELIILLTLQRQSKLSPTDTKLLQSSPAYQRFPEYIDQIAALLSHHLTKQALPLTRLLHPTTNASFLHRNVPQLPTAVQALRTRIATERADLLAARLALTPCALEALRTYTLCTQATIRCLETTKHGVLARHSKTSAELLSLQAQATKLETHKTAIVARSVVYTPEVRRALRVYGENLRDQRARLGMRRRDAERVLAGYGVAQEEDEVEDEDRKMRERTMKEIARVWGEMENQLEGVRRDIGRLSGQ